MAEIRFYQLLRSSLEQALPPLVQGALRLSPRLVILAGSEARMDSLNSALWTFDDASFLPHGSRKDGHAADQPIYLTDREECPNGADGIVLVDGMEVADRSRWAQIFDIFDGNDPAAKDAARARFRTAKAEGHSLKYFEQMERGWEQRA